VKVCPVCGTEYGDDAAFCSRDRSSLRPAAGGSNPGLIGQLIGERYQVERRLGEGGMGEVYLARHLLMGRLCALKVMSQSLSRDPDAVSRFNREATNASRISHPNVCAVYDFGLTPDGLVYLAMEYVEGRALSLLLDQEGPLPVQRAATLVVQCAHGLQVAHDLGIVHRDLKPDNIMVAPAKEREVAKLVDFGIAKAMESGPGQRVTKSGFVVGTPEYMAPEQLAGDPLDGRSDQYALALVFYRAITGTLPFEGSTVQETLVKRLTDPPRPLAMARPGGRFPAGLQRVMDRALARDPGERYPSVTAFSDAVSGIIRGDAVATRPMAEARAHDPVAIPPTRQSPRKKPPAGVRFVIALGAVIVAGAGAWVIFDSNGSAPVQPIPGTAAPSPPPSAPRSDTTPGQVETLGKSAPTPGPAAKPVAPRVLATSGAADSAATDTLVPEPEQFDDPVRRSAMIRRAERILNSPTQPAPRRAFAAASLGHVALRFRNNKSAALAFYRQANLLAPGNPRWESMIRQLQDSVPE
jgi:serine/threonine-protein kinase